MQHFVRGVIGGVLLVLLASLPAAAQATAQLGGAVRDDSGGVLPGVTVTATQTDTGFTRSVVTDAGGAYEMPNLPTGPYRRVAAAGPAGDRPDRAGRRRD